MSSDQDPLRAALNQIASKRGVRRDYPADVDAEVAEIVAAGVEIDGLVDRREMAFVTIDNHGSRDLDQALYVESRPRGGFTVYYALADGAHYVRPKTALFAEAVARGASYYLPTHAIPMLPRPLSEDLVSLNPGVDRRSLLFIMELDADGQPETTTLERAAIRSRAKLTYPGVQAYYDGDTDSLSDPEVRESLDLLRIVGALRVAAEHARDVIQYNRDELIVARAGDRLSAHRRVRLPVEEWNAQVSMLCNAEGARLLLEASATDDDQEVDDVQPVFRTHPAPLEQRLAQLEQMIRDIVSHHEELDAAVWTWRRGSVRLASYLEQLPRDDASRRVRKAIERQILYTNQASEFTAFAGPHHALGLTEYARFSAPMREIVGIFTHKEALEALGHIESQPSDDDRALRNAVIEAANEAKKLQRRLDKDGYALALDHLLEDELALETTDRAWMRGTILGVRSSRIYVSVDTPPIEIKLYREDLEAAFDSARFRLADSDVALESDDLVFAVGHAIEVRVASRRRDRWRFDVRHVRGVT